MTTAVLRCNAFYQEPLNVNSNNNDIAIFQSNYYKDLVDYKFNGVKTATGKAKNNNKALLPYVHIAVNFLLTGDVTTSDHIILDAKKKHFNLRLHEYELQNILSNVSRILRLREKDTTPTRIVGFFTKYNPYGLEIVLRRDSDLSVTIYEYDNTNWNLTNADSFTIRLGWLDIDIDDRELHEEIIAKCRFCNETVGFCNNVLEFYYCTKHGFMNNENYIMYFARKSKASDWVGIRRPYTANIEECPFLIENNNYCHYGVSCAFAHSELEMNVWKFIIEKEINLQILAAHQQKEKKRLIRFSNNRVFNRCHTLHQIINSGNLEELKTFIKYSKSDVFADYNDNGQSILHTAVKNDDHNLIKLLLDGCKLTDCIETKVFTNYDFHEFVNHKSYDGNTALALFLLNIKEFNDNSEKIFDCFVECQDCEIGEALDICKEKRLLSFEKKIVERMYDDQF